MEYRCLDVNKKDIGSVNGKNIKDAKVNLIYCEMGFSIYESKVYYLKTPKGKVISL